MHRDINLITTEGQPAMQIPLTRSRPGALRRPVGARTVRQFGARGCACRMAQEFGDHPEAAAERMRWVRQLITQIPAPR